MTKTVLANMSFDERCEHHAEELAKSWRVLNDYRPAPVALWLQKRVIECERDFAPMGACQRHGGDDHPDDCERCELIRLFNGEPCFADPVESRS